MSFNGSGTYNLPAPPYYPAVAGTIIYADYFNFVMEDLGAALSLCVTTDGQAVVTADLPMAGHALKGLRAGVAAGESTEYAQVFTSPVFSDPRALADPPLGDNSQRLITSSWFMQTLSAPLYSAVMNIYAYQNF